MPTSASPRTTARATAAQIRRVVDRLRCCRCRDRRPRGPTRCSTPIEVLLERIARVVATDRDAHRRRECTDRARSGPDARRRVPTALSQVADTVRRVDGEAEIPRVTPALLRRADECAGAGSPASTRAASATPTRRPTRGSRSRTGSAKTPASRRPSSARRARRRSSIPPISSPSSARSTAPRRAAISRRSAIVPGRAADLGWRTHLDELGVDLIADLGLALELPDGRPRAARAAPRHARTRARRCSTPCNCAFALVRTEEWAPDQLTIVAADVIEQESERHAPDLARERADARAWITERVELVQELAADGRARPAPTARAARSSPAATSSA